MSSPPHDEQPNTPTEASDGINVNQGFEFPRLSGPGVSVALSVAVFLVVLAVGVSYDHAHRLRGQQPASQDTRSNGAVLNGVHAPSSSLMEGLASGTSRVLLAHARDCARAGQWDCVDESPHAAHALDDDAQEAARLQPLFNHNPPSPALMSDEPRYDARNAYKSGMRKAGARTHGKHHLNHHLNEARTARGTMAVTRRAPPEFLVDLYRH